MKDLFTKTIKNALISFAIGAVLALCAPALASALHISVDLGIGANPLWLGGFFGLCGGITPAISTVVNTLFDGNKATIEEQPQRRASTLTIEMSPEQEKEIAAGLGNFRERVKNGRVTEESQSRSA